VNTHLPDKPGTYVLCLSLAQSTQIQIGKLGLFSFSRGFYFYVGSAFGPGGIRARCGHHIKHSSKPRWHIDYLRQHCDLSRILCSTDNQHLEHQWADIISSVNEISAPVNRFGSSDCSCQSHLFFCTDNKIDVVLNTLKTQSTMADIKLTD